MPPGQFCWLRSILYCVAFHDIVAIAGVWRPLSAIWLHIRESAIAAAAAAAGVDDDEDDDY